MISKFSKHVIIGIIGVVISITLLILGASFLNISNIWIIYILLMIDSGFLFGSMMYIFGGKKEFLYGVIMGIGGVTFIFMSKNLPYPFNAVLCIAFFVVILTVRISKEYLFDRERTSASPKIKRIAKKIKEEEELRAKINDENEIILSSIDYGQKSLILETKSGSIYQCIKGNEKFYFVYIGSQFRGVDLDDLISDFSDERKFITKKKDYIINKTDICFIKYKINKHFNSVGILTMKCNNFSKRFNINSITEENLQGFFDGIEIKMKSRNAEKHMDAFEFDDSNVEYDPELIAKLKSVCMILTIISIVVSFIFLFLNINYKIMSMLCIVIITTILTLYIKYNGVLSLSDKKNTKFFSQNRVNITMSLIIPCIIVGLRSLLDFKLTAYNTFLTLSILLFLGILFIFFKFTNEYKKEKTSIFIILVVAFCFAPSAVIQINYAFDNSKGTVFESIIYDKEITEDSKHGDSYYIKVVLPENKNIELEVSKEYYENHCKGVIAEVVEKEGFLKVPYAFVIQN